MNKRPSRPFELWLLIISLIIIGISGLISGALFILSPDGQLMGMSPDLLTGSPFKDFLVPGIILFLFLGVFPIFAGYGLIQRPGWRWPNAVNICGRYHWSWTASWTGGVIILIWLIVQTGMLGYIFFLQPVMAVWGSAIIILAMLPRVRNYYRSS